MKHTILHTPGFHLLQKKHLESSKLHELKVLWRPQVAHQGQLRLRHVLDLPPHHRLEPPWSKLALRVAQAFCDALEVRVGQVDLGFEVLRNVQSPQLATSD